MPSVTVDFHRITSHLGAQNEAFEELCCQNDRHCPPEQGGEFLRYRGAGGDGGVECIWRLSSGKEWGLQAKYIFELPKALTKLSESLETAIRVHPQLERYTVCLPFDLTGPTGRRTRSGAVAQSQYQQFEDWRNTEQKKALDAGVNLSIILVTPSTILDTLQSYDRDGGRLRFWFDATIFTQDWFERHIREVRHLAGPRYTPEVSVEVPIAKALEGLGLTKRWFDEATSYYVALRKLLRDWERAVGNDKEGGWDTPFPVELKEKGARAGVYLNAILQLLQQVAAQRQVPIPQELSSLVAQKALPLFRELQTEMSASIDAKHGEGASDSASFRQFQAEYQVSFPTANLDRAKELTKLLDTVFGWLGSASSCVAGKEAALIIGEAGAGKTHLLCDAATQRHERGLRTVLLFGERFSSAAEPWTQIQQHLGLPSDIGREALLSALDATGEATGRPLLLCLDGLNDTTPRNYWHAHLGSIVASAQPYPFIKLCASCRTTYLPEVFPSGTCDWHIVPHEGFRGMEFDACRAFFAFYGLEAPMTPLLQTEFSNPLFLKLICDAAKEEGHNQLPVGWQGIFSAISVLLKAKNRKFAAQYSLQERHRIAENGLQLFIDAVRSGPRSALAFDRATAIIQKAVPLGANCGLLIDWLVGESLLIVDAEVDDNTGKNADFVRIAFDRLGDHLLASSLLDGLTHDTLAEAFQRDGILHRIVQDVPTANQNKGLLEALSIQLPELYGRELYQVLEESECDAEALPLVLEITLKSLLWRDTRHLTSATIRIVQEGLTQFPKITFDSLIEVASQPSPIDGFFLDTVLRSRPMPHRDAFWCPHLYKSFSDKEAVEKLIRAGLEMDVSRISEEIAERWATALLWFCAAADRRIRDYATKALVRITEQNPCVWERLIERFADCDDEYVVERCLVCAYGVLLRSQNIEVISKVAQAAFDTVFRDSARFQNAAIRDYARLILEMANSQGVLPNGIAEADYMPPYQSEWPLEIPTEEDIKPFEAINSAYPKLLTSCTFDDFFIYTLYRLRKYENIMTDPEMGRWVFRHVLDMGYGRLRGHANYDSYLLYEYGGGRGKPTWAERIGKKYQWIALARLAARLSDNNEPQEDTWEPAPANVPLVYLRGRDIDPSFPVEKNVLENRAWWQPVAYKQRPSFLDDSAWLNEIGDIPDSVPLISFTAPNGQSWLALENHCDWTEEGEDDEDIFDGNRRSLWMQIRSYLVADSDFEQCWEWIQKQHFMGRWMPEGVDFHEGFLGEYPWATTFNTYPEEWFGRGGFSSTKGSPVDLFPTANSLSSRDEYDAYETESNRLFLPSRVFFHNSHLKWDAGAGYQDGNGRQCFFDSGFRSENPSALLVNPAYLTEFLEQHRFRVIWTVLAEKLVLNDRAMPRLHYSRVHTLSDGQILSSSPQIERD